MRRIGVHLADEAREFIAEVLRLRPESVTDSLEFRSIPEWDSLGHINLILALEARYRTPIDEDGLVALTNVGAIRAFMEGRAHAAAPDALRVALAASDRRGARRALGRNRPVLSLPEEERLSAHLESLPEKRQPLRIASLRTYTTEFLRPHWRLESLLAGFDLQFYEAPYASLLQEGEKGSALLTFEPEVTFLFLQWQDLDPRFLHPLSSLTPEQRADLAAAARERLLRLLRPLREAVPGLFVVTLLPRLLGPELGFADAMAPHPEAQFFIPLKTEIAAAFRASLPAVQYFDLDEIVARVGRENFFDSRLWEMARSPFSARGAQAVVRDLFACAWLLKGPLTKCIVLDADNTLWGGIVGEDGPQGIALGPEAPGSAYVAFQRRLLELRERGILLALCSRNNWSEVREILQRHPHQLLREEHFAAARVNWEPKSVNLRAIAGELNLGLENFLFVDDSPQECLLLERQFPELEVVCLPDALSELPSCLDGLPGLERLTLTREDSDRSRYYAQDRERKRLEVESATVADYLGALRMVMTVGLNDSSAAGRIAQLTQKTNQFNLTTRRYTEAEISRWVHDPDGLVAHFSLSDIFGDSGIVGVALIRGLSGSEPEFDTFLLSCRVIGRGAETAFLQAILGVLRTRAVARVRASFIPTGRNVIVQDFWPRHGFGETGPGQFALDLKTGAPPSEVGPISVVFAEPASPVAHGERT
jgi:FkbH-like protein